MSMSVNSYTFRKAVSNSIQWNCKISLKTYCKNVVMRRLRISQLQIPLFGQLGISHQLQLQVFRLKIIFNQAWTNHKPHLGNSRQISSNWILNQLLVFKLTRVIHLLSNRLINLRQTRHQVTTQKFSNHLCFNNQDSSSLSSNLNQRSSSSASSQYFSSNRTI